jgi:LPXTG-motif cell wall-anchored protein
MTTRLGDLQMILKRIGLALAVVGIGVFGVDAAASAQYPPAAAIAVVSNQTPPPNASFTVTVRNCEAGESVRFSLPTVAPVTVTCVPPVQSLTSAAALTEGATATATLVAPAQAGPYNGTAELLTSEITLPFSITVTAVTAPGGGLPATGSDGTQSFVWYGLGLFAVGAGLVAVAQVRRRQTRLA